MRTVSNKVEAANAAGFQAAQDGAAAEIAAKIGSTFGDAVGRMSRGGGKKATAQAKEHLLLVCVCVCVRACVCVCGYLSAVCLCVLALLDVTKYTAQARKTARHRRRCLRR